MTQEISIQHFLLFLGVVFSISSICLLISIVKTRKLIKQGNFEIATVIRTINHRQTSRSMVMQRPVFEYTIDGIRYEKISSTGTHPPKYKVGQKIKIYYSSENPDQSIMEGDDKISVILFFIFAPISVIIILALIWLF